jgi:hypothetical protein
MPPENKNLQKLPPKTEDHIVDVSISHLLVGFVLLAGGVFGVGVTLIIIRDYSRYKRQKAIIDSSLEIIKTLVKNKENQNEKN